jgi:hypothetical protein
MMIGHRACESGQRQANILSQGMYYYLTIRLQSYPMDRDNMSRFC